MRLLTTLILISSFLLTALPAWAVTGREIIDRANSIRKPDTVISELTMRIYREKRVAEKRFALKTKLFENNQRKTLIAFTKPTRLKLLTITHQEREDDQWLRMSNGKIKRITTSSKGKPFVNSHFTYEDMISRNIDHYQYQYKGDAEFCGDICYRVESQKKSGRKIYDRTVFYIRKSDYYILRIDFYKDGRFIKYLANYDIKETDGIITPYKIVMTSATKGKTEIYLNDVTYNIAVPESQFKKESLR